MSTPGGVDSDRPVFGDAGRRRVGERESSLLPRGVRPDVVRWAWALLALLLAGLVMLAVVLGGLL
jgi:hypothetical protein